MRKILLIASLALCFTNLIAQWEQCEMDFGKYETVAADNSHVFAAHFEFGYDYGWMGDLLRSLDNGITWEDWDSGLANPCVYSLIISGSEIIAGTSSGIFITDIDENSWIQSNTGLTFTFILSLASNGSNVFAGTNGGGIFFSNNNGETWTEKNTGLENLYVNDVAICDTNIFAATDSGIYLSTNNGDVWTSVNEGITDFSVASLTVSGNNIFAGTQDGLFISSDNGTVWTPVNNDLPSTDIRLLISKDTIVFSSPFPEGVYITITNGANWSDFNYGWAYLVINDLAVNDTFIFAAVQNYVWRRSISGISGNENCKIADKKYLPFPNPANDKIQIDLPENTQKIDLYNFFGEKLQSFTNESKFIEINTKSLPAGTYIIRINTKNEVISNRFIKE